MMSKKNITAIIGFLGAASGLAGLFVYTIWAEDVWRYTTLEILAVIFLSIFFISHFETLKDFSSQRSTKFGVNSFLMVLIFTSILGLINFILSRHEIRLDLSDTGAFSLSPQTENILKHLQHDVVITGFFTEQSEKRSRAKDLMENYKRLSGKLDFLLVDPDKKPGMAKQYGITEYDTVVLSSAGRSSVARTVTEEGLTSALIRISREDEKTFYFIEGHGERGIDDVGRQGYSRLKETLKKQGFTVNKLILLTEEKIPEDADVVIIGGPQRPFSSEEQTHLRSYLNRNGQLFIALDPMVDSGFEAFLSEWGVTLKDDIILDPGSGLGPAIPTINPEAYPPHEITENFNLATFFPLSRSVLFDPSKGALFQFTSFLESGPNTWRTEQTDGDLSVNPKRDQKGPITFGAIITSKQPEPTRTSSESGASERMRIVVVGDSDFGTNGVAKAAGNGDLFQNIISWLADEGDLVSIRPQEIPTTTLLLDAQQTGVIFTVSVLILPLGIMGIGLIIWRKRRRL